MHNQRGLGRVATPDIHRGLTVARGCTSVCERWRVGCRAAHAGGRLEAIASRPRLLAAASKAGSHAQETTPYPTPTHGPANVLERLIADTGAALQHGPAAAAQDKDLDRSGCLPREPSHRIAPDIGPPRPPTGPPAAG